MSVVISTMTLANSHRLLRQYASTRYSLSAVPIAKVGDEMVRDWWMTAAAMGPTCCQRKSGETAARRTLRRIGAQVRKRRSARCVLSNDGGASRGGRQCSQWLFPDQWFFVPRG